MPCCNITKDDSSTEMTDFAVHSKSSKPATFAKLGQPFRPDAKPLYLAQHLALRAAGNFMVYLQKLQL